MYHVNQNCLESQKTVTEYFLGKLLLSSGFVAIIFMVMCNEHTRKYHYPLTAGAAYIRVFIFY